MLWWPGDECCSSFSSTEPLIGLLKRGSSTVRTVYPAMFYFSFLASYVMFNRGFLRLTSACLLCSDTQFWVVTVPEKTRENYSHICMHNSVVMMARNLENDVKKNY